MQTKGFLIGHSHREVKLAVKHESSIRFVSFLFWEKLIWGIKWRMGDFLPWHLCLGNSWFCIRAKCSEKINMMDFRKIRFTHREKLKKKTKIQQEDFLSFKWGILNVHPHGKVWYMVQYESNKWWIMHMLGTFIWWVYKKWSKLQKSWRINIRAFWFLWGILNVHSFWEE